MKKLFILAVMVIIMAFPCTVQAASTDSSRVILESYKITEGKLKAGNEINLELCFRNVSSSVEAKNVLITINNDTNEVFPSDGNGNQIFISTLKPDEKVVKNTKWRVTSNLQFDGETTLRIHTNHYEKADGNRIETIENDVTIGLSQLENKSLEVNNASIVKSVMVDNNALISIEYENVCDYDLKDVELHIDGKIDKKHSKTNIGDISRGARKYLDSYVMFAEEGKQSVDVYFTYKDRNDKEYESQHYELNTMVTKNNTMTPIISTDDTDNQDQHMKLVETVVILVIILIIVLITVIIVSRKKRNF